MGDYKIGYPSQCGISGELVFNLNDHKWLNCIISCNENLFPPYNIKSDMEISIPPNQKTAILGVNVYSISVSCYFSNDNIGTLPTVSKDY